MGFFGFIGVFKLFLGFLIFDPYIDMKHHFTNEFDSYYLDLMGQYKSRNNKSIIRKKNNQYLKFIL